jgi:hypothetical protein
LLHPAISAIQPITKIRTTTLRHPAHPLPTPVLEAGGTDVTCCGLGGTGAGEEAAGFAPDNGNPQCGHEAAWDETSFLHSGQVVSAIGSFLVGVAVARCGWVVGSLCPCR